MTSITDFNHYECPKIDARQVDAYFDLRLDTEDPTKLLFDSSWGALDPVDLTPAVQAAEHIDHLMLDPADSPVYLRFDNEAGDSECINGDDLSRIISMRYLKDVDQSEAPSVGDVYMLGENGLFVPTPFSTEVGGLVGEIEDLDTRVTALESQGIGPLTQIEQLQQQVASIIAQIADLDNRLTVVEDIIFASS